MASTRPSIPSYPFYSTFLQRAFDQVVHDVCLQNLPVTLIADRAGIVGEDGKTHHGAFDISYLRCLPNAVVAAPMDENDLQHLIYTAYKYPGPFAIRIARGPATGAPLDSNLKELPIGRGAVVREGSDVVIFGLGKAANAAVTAAELLADYGIACGVVNPLFVKPLDLSLLLDAARSTRRIVTVEENVLAGGFGLGGAGGPVRSRNGVGPGSPHRYAGLLYRAWHGGRPTAPAATGRRGHRSANPDHLLSRLGPIAAPGQKPVGKWPPELIKTLAAGVCKLQPPKSGKLPPPRLPALSAHPEPVEGLTTSYG